MVDIKAQGMDIREPTDKAKQRSTWRLLVRASSSANAWRRRKLELDHFPIVRSLWNNGVVCMYVFMHVCMHKCMYISVYLCICMYYACMYVCMYACIIHTYMIWCMYARNDFFYKITLSNFLKWFRELARIP